MKCPRCAVDTQTTSAAPWIGTCPTCKGSVLRTLVEVEVDGEPAPDAPGSVLLTDAFLDKYDIVRPIGEGATASVFLGRDLKNDVPVAIKFLAVLGRGPVMTRFAREAKLLSHLLHPNVIRLLDSGEIDRRPYLVSEFCEGGTLRARIEKGLTTREALRIMRDILAGLAAVHEAGLVHRDLKPENVLLSGDGAIRLADLGLAREQVSGGEPSLTPKGAVIGTPRYMAPEQVRGERATPRTDLYAAATMLHEMLTGEPPFSDENTFELLRAQLERTPKRLREIRPELKVALEVVVQRGLAKDPAARHESARAMLAEIERAERVLDGKEPDVEPLPAQWAAPRPSAALPPPPPEASPKVLGGVATFGAVVMVMLAALGLGHRGGPVKPSALPVLPGLMDPRALHCKQKLELARHEREAGHPERARTYYEQALALATALKDEATAAEVRKELLSSGQPPGPATR